MTRKRKCYSERLTSDGLTARYNRALKLWEYFRWTPAGERMTGSTRRYQHN